MTMSQEPQNPFSLDPAEMGTVQRLIRFSEDRGDWEIGVAPYLRSEPRLASATREKLDTGEIGDVPHVNLIFDQAVGFRSRFPLAASDEMPLRPGACYSIRCANPP